MFINLAHYYGKRPCQPCSWSTRGFACALPDQWLWHLTWERDFMCACVQNMKMASFATESHHESVVNGFYWPGEFEAMKTLSGWEATRCDGHQFRAKIKVSTWAVFELSLFDKWSEQERRPEKWHFCYRTLSRLAVFRLALGYLWVLLITTALKEEAWALK